MKRRTAGLSLIQARRLAERCVTALQKEHGISRKECARFANEAYCSLMRPGTISFQGVWAGRPEMTAKETFRPSTNAATCSKAAEGIS